MVSVGDEEPAMVVTNLRKALAEIDELSAERASIEEALKEERNRDNILPKLMASSGRSDNIFAEEIKKYDEHKARVAAYPPMCRNLIAFCLHPCNKVPASHNTYMQTRCKHVLRDVSGQCSTTGHGAASTGHAVGCVWVCAIAHTCHSVQHCIHLHQA